jgi:hypothetical protein
MAIKVQDILDEVAGDIQDTGKVRTTNERLLEFYNNALLQVVIVRPDANAVTKNIALVSGTKQTLPPGDMRLLDLTRNMGALGNTPGAAVLQGNLDAQNRFNPDWHTETGSPDIEEWFYDYRRNPTAFYVSPPAVEPTYVEVSVSTSPAIVTDPQTNMELIDIYKGPVMSWMKYQFYMRQTESQFAVLKAREHKEAFYQTLGIKYEAEKTVAPAINKVPNTE